MSQRNPLSQEARKILHRERGRIARRQGRLGEAIDTAARLGDATLDANQEREAAFIRGVVRNVEAVLASERVVVPAKVQPGRMSASTDFESINVTYPVVPDIRQQSAILRSLMYHEGGHIRWTLPIPVLCRMGDADLPPTRTTWTDKYDGHPQVWHRVWNALEDQRMETAVTSDSPVKAKYLTALILNQFVSTPQAAAANWPLLIWRRYLPRKIRVMARRLFVDVHGEDLAVALEEVTQRYVLATTAADMLQAISDAIPLYEGLRIGDLDDHRTHRYRRVRDGETINPDDILIPIDPSMIDDEDEDGEGAPSGSGDEVSDEAVETGQPGGGADEASDEDGGPTTDPQPMPSRTDGKSNEPAPDPIDTPSKGAGRSEEPNVGTGEDAPAEPKPSKPSKPVKDMSTEEVADALEEAKAAADKERYEDKATAADERAFNENLGNSDSKLLPYHTGLLNDPEKLNEAGVLSATIEQAFRVATMDREPAWVEQQTRGIVNPLRYETRQPGDRDFFRQWTDDDQPGHNIAVSIMLDYSGSMGDATEQLSQAAYAMKLACQNLGIPCTVTLWDDHATVLWDASEPCGDALPFIDTRGGTDPTKALTDLDNQRLDKERHLVLMMTDGSWVDEWIRDEDGMTPRPRRSKWDTGPVSTKHLSGWAQPGRYFLLLGLDMDARWFATDMKAKGADEAHGIDNLAEMPHYLEQALIDLG